MGVLFGIILACVFLSWLISGFFKVLLIIVFIAYAAMSFVVSIPAFFKGNEVTNEDNVEEMGKKTD